MEEKEEFLCIDCCVDLYLRNYVEKNLDSNNICFICNESKGVINIDNPDLNDFCRFLIRYNYPEHFYNSHWGGEDLPSLFFDDNLILSNKFNNQDFRKDEIAETLEFLFDLNNPSSKIDLYYGYDEFGRNLWPKAIKSENSRIWQTYKSDLKIKNYYHLEEKAKETFKSLLENLKFTLKPGNHFFRARIGYTEKEEEVQMGYGVFSLKVPYSSSQISAPPVSKTTAGRANRQGVSFLYIASDEETALGEIRPHPGHYVSLGEFKNVDQLVLADLRFIDLYDYYKDEKKRELFLLLRDLSHELSIPILPDEKENYLVTQFISDIIRQVGFDGILFKSSVSKGYNLVAFDPERFINIESKSKLIKIKSINFVYKEVEFEQDGFLDILIEK